MSGYDTMPQQDSLLSDEIVTCQDDKVLWEDSSGNLQGPACGGEGFCYEAPPLGILIKHSSSPPRTHLQ